jgi:hypothetical protein
MNDLEVSYDPTPEFSEWIQGSVGQFQTVSGTVAFVLTKARLGPPEGDDPHQRLTKHLRPFREVVPAAELEFSQLLQRDIDDHRVATKLIPYLMTTAAMGPSFFPPILCMMLPFQESRPSSHFSSPEEITVHEAHGAYWQGARIGAAFKIEHLSNAEGERHPLEIARVSWNPEHAKLVVLDGQHRAMALLAIERTRRGMWDEAGAQYQHFYIDAVNDLLASLGEDEEEQLRRIEVPVAVCWLPDLLGDEHYPHRAARQLFVVVNREAKSPSRSRLILLSDTDLFYVFVRAILDRLKAAEGGLPLYAIEYDNPEEESARPVKWSVLTNLMLLGHVVQRVLGGPDRVLTQPERPLPGGPQRGEERDQFLRRELNVNSLFPANVPDGERTIPRDSIGREHFPGDGVDTLKEAFMAGWGTVITNVFERLLPYRSHIRALEALKQDWTPGGDEHGRLAKEAIFGGVGSYWTLRSSYEDWRDDQAAGTGGAEEPAVVEAWEVLGNKAGEFRRARAREYLGSDGTDDLRLSEHVYESVFITHACQLGIFLAIASLAKTLDRRGSDLVTLADDSIAAWNRALDSEREGGDSRKLFLARDESLGDRINWITDMNTPRAPLFRYFWLELLQVEPAAADLDANVIEAARTLGKRARRGYWEYLVHQRELTLRRDEPELDDEERASRVREAEAERLSVGLRSWFGVDEQEFQAWLAEVSEASPADDGEE